MLQNGSLLLGHTVEYLCVHLNFNVMQVPYVKEALSNFYSTSQEVDPFYKVTYYNKWVKTYWPNITAYSFYIDGQHFDAQYRLSWMFCLFLNILYKFLYKNRQDFLDIKYGIMVNIIREDQEEV